jgi:hypothetical protein
MTMTTTTTAKTLNDVVLFAVELAAWAGYGVWGWQVGTGPWRWVLAIALPAAVITMWSVLAAPRSRRRLRDPALAAFQLAVFLVSAALLVAAGRPAWGWPLAMVAVVVVVVDRALPHRNPAS